jgi:phosphoglycerol transferase
MRFLQEWGQVNNAFLVLIVGVSSFDGVIITNLRDQAESYGINLEVLTCITEVEKWRQLKRATLLMFHIAKRHLNPSHMRYPQLVSFLKRQEKLLSGIALSLSITLIWVWVYNRTSLVACQTPLVYEGDSLFGMALAKAFMDGDIFPVWYKWVGHLNAPFFANWNDYPLIEEVIFAIMGWLGKVVGLFPVANFMLLFAHLSAGLSFWYVSRKLKYRSAFVFSGAILFAFSHYIFCRSLGHITLSYYWIVPLGLMVTWWTYSSKPIKINSPKWWWAIIISAITGVFNVYYTGMFLQFLGVAVLLHLAKKQYSLIRFPLLLIGVTMSCFLLMNVDTLSYSLHHGANYQAVSRNLAALEIYALKIPEMIFPPGYHRWHFWADYGQRHYFQVALIKGEMGSPYLGLMGLLGLTWLAGIALYRSLQVKSHLIPVHAWQTLWILLFSLVGGINLLLGTFGFILFRGTNRYSIVILAIVLLFWVRQLSRKCPAKMVLPVAVAIAVIGLWDQLPPRASAEQIQQTADIVRSDRKFAKELESQLPQNGMVFQLPVAAFPEIPPIYKMADYEHFRPYLFTQHLHYSYGTNKGRGDSDWQNELCKLAPAEMASKLEDYGFAAMALIIVSATCYVIG